MAVATASCCRLGCHGLQEFLLPLPVLLLVDFMVYRQPHISAQRNLESNKWRTFTYYRKQYSKIPFSFPSHIVCWKELSFLKLQNFKYCTIPLYVEWEGVRKRGALSCVSEFYKKRDGFVCVWREPARRRRRAATTTSTRA